MLGANCRSCHFFFWLILASQKAFFAVPFTDCCTRVTASPEGHPILADEVLTRNFYTLFSFLKKKIVVVSSGALFGSFEV